MEKSNNPIFITKSGIRLEISTNAIQLMRQFIQDRPNILEAGGVLLGRYIIDTHDVVIDEVTLPNSKDKRGRYWFFRTAKPHQRLIRKAWLESDGTCNYLGEWHTHPESHPTPSSIDLLGWRKKLYFDKFDNDFLLFLIFGIEEYCVWLGKKNNLHFEKLLAI